MSSRVWGTTASPVARRRLFAVGADLGKMTRPSAATNIRMTVAGRELAFSTCHLCEAKWWYRDGKVVPLQSVIGLVVQQ